MHTGAKTHDARGERGCTQSMRERVWQVSAPEAVPWMQCSAAFVPFLTDTEGPCWVPGAGDVVQTSQHSPCPPGVTVWWVLYPNAVTLRKVTFVWREVFFVGGALEVSKKTVVKVKEVGHGEGGSCRGAPGLEVRVGGVS